MEYILKLSFQDKPNCMACLLSTTKNDNYICPAIGARPICPDEGCLRNCPLEAMKNSPPD